MTIYSCRARRPRDLTMTRNKDCEQIEREIHPMLSDRFEVLCEQEGQTETFFIWLTKDGKRRRFEISIDEWDDHCAGDHNEIARNSVESKRPSELIDYATATPLTIDFLETAFAIDDNNIGI